MCNLKNKEMSFDKPPSKCTDYIWKDIQRASWRGEPRGRGLSSQGMGLEGDSHSHYITLHYRLTLHSIAFSIF